MIDEKRRRRWNHPSVRKLMMDNLSSDPIAIIRKKARELVEKAKAMDWKGPPFDPQILASIKGIKVRETTKLFSAEAQLTPMDGNQLLLEFNPERATGRKNFSICHEIAHTLFEDHYEMVHQRKSDPVAFDPQEEVELLCQIAAAEILMPIDDFCEDLKRLAFNLETVLKLKDKYWASREAVARRMLSLAGKTSALVFFSERLKPIEIQQGGGDRFSPKMRILRSVTSGDFPTYLPAHKSVPDDSCIYQANQTDLIKTGVEFWGIRDSGEWKVEALGLPTPGLDNLETPSVLALILPK